MSGFCGKAELMPLLLVVAIRFQHDERDESERGEHQKDFHSFVHGLLPVLPGELSSLLSAGD